MINYSLFNSRKIFNPFQYKPYFKIIGEEVGKIKLNEKDRRLYISDEVGLGKTIEAGIIIMNLLKNNIISEQDKIAIIAPNILVKKWQDELLERFNIDFEIVNRESINTSSNKIICKESIFRNDNFNIDFKLKLIVVDEAHHFRNSNTNQYRNLENMIANIAEDGYIIMLSATPYNNNNCDLYNQTKLLFKNKLILNEEDKVHYFTNSKKAIAFKNLYKRNHFLVHVQLTIAEKALYNFVKEWYYQNNIKDYSGFGLNAIEKMGTSCIQMLIEYLTASYIIEERYLDKEADLENEDVKDFKTITTFINNSGKKLKTKKQVYRLKSILMEKGIKIEEDKKLEELKKCLNEIKDNKIIIFTFYIKVAEYLKENLKVNYDVRTLTGATDENERIANFSWFKNNSDSKDTKILVCSDVCKEGLDLQFCSNLINYDLPYNPVTVEQRIGRIDRMGQTKDVNIYSLYVEDTYDYKLYCILYSKLRAIGHYALKGVGNKADILINEKEFKLFKTNFEKWIKEIEMDISDFENTKNKYIRDKIERELDQLIESFNIIRDNGKRNYKDEIENLKKLFMKDRDDEKEDKINEEEVTREYEKCENEIKKLLFNKKTEESFEELSKKEIKSVVETLNCKLKKYDAKIEEKEGLIHSINVSEKFSRFIDELLNKQGGGRLRNEIENWFDNLEEFLINKNKIRPKLILKSEVKFEYSIGDGNVDPRLFLPLYGEFFYYVNKYGNVD